MKIKEIQFVKPDFPLTLAVTNDCAVFRAFSLTPKIIFSIILGGKKKKKSGAEACNYWLLMLIRGDFGDQGPPEGDLGSNERLRGLYGPTIS